MKLEINNRRKSGNFTDKLINIYLIKNQLNEKIIREI